jgi:transporter family protein
MSNDRRLDGLSDNRHRRKPEEAPIVARVFTLDHSSSALTKAISADIVAYINQLLFGIGVLPVMVIVIVSERLAGGTNRRRGIFYAFMTGVLGGTGNIAFFKAFTEGGKASLVVPATSLSPLATAVLGYFLLKERASRYQKAASCWRSWPSTFSAFRTAESAGPNRETSVSSTTPASALRFAFRESSRAGHFPEAPLCTFRSGWF